MQDYIRLKDAAEFIGFSESTIRRWIRANMGIPFMRTPTGVYLFERKALRDWITQMKGQ